MDFPWFAQFITTRQSYISVLVMQRDLKAHGSNTSPRSRRARSLISKRVCGKHEPNRLFGAHCISALNAFKVLWGPALKSDHLLWLDTLKILSHQELGAVHLLLVNGVKSWGENKSLGQQPEAHNHLRNSKWLPCLFLILFFFYTTKGRCGSMQILWKSISSYFIVDEV